MNHVNLSIAVHLPRQAVQPTLDRGLGQCCLRLSSGVEGSELDTIVFAVNKTGWHRLGRRIGALILQVDKTHSLGQVRLRSADPDVTPEVTFNMLEDQRDVARLMSGLRLCLEILADPRLARVAHEAFLPNSAVAHRLWRRTWHNALTASAISWLFDMSAVRAGLLRRALLDPRSLLADPLALRKTVLQRANVPRHVSCTCRMGRPTDPGAVVDPDCRVIGMRNLRVVDASVMPTLVRAPTHIPVLMIAEKMADRIRASHH